MTPQISVVVPTHDRPDLLGRTLRTVLWQEGVDFEVVVVDDGDSRPAVDVVAELADPRVRVVPAVRPHSGPCAARNVGIAHTSGAWVAFLDDDDLWAPDKLASQLLAVAQMPEAGWVTSGAISVDENLDVLAWQGPPSPGMQRRQVAVNVIPGGGSATAVAREVLEKVGGFDESMRHHGDYEMWVRVSLVAPLAVVDRPVTGYMMHSGGLSRGTAGGRAAKARLRPELERLQAQMGVQPAFESWDYLWGNLELRSGRRWDAASTYGRLAVAERSPRLLGRAAWAAAAPKSLLRRSQRWERRQVPPAVLAEAQEWLGRVPVAGARPRTG